MMPAHKVAILTVSDRSYLALREDKTGPVIARRVEEWGWTVVSREILPDEQDQIAAWLRHTAESDTADLILTTGGTGFSVRDRVPEATLEAVDRLAPGILEWIRAVTGAENPHAYLSRGVAGMRGATLIVNLPGSPRGVEEYLDCLQRILPHALEQLRLGAQWGEQDRHPGSA
jgi:molybdopterin adenylyltransferase